MFSNKKVGILLTILLALTIVLVACQPEVVEVVQEVEVTRVVTETVVEEGETIEVTRVVTEVEEVVVTPEAEPAGPIAAPDPETYTHMTFGDPDTLDPALAYDTASSAVIDQVMEGLIAYNHTDSTTFVPALAVEVPSVENGGISEDGLTYTFNIREGVTFHNGNELTPSDVAYHFQRGLLQSDPNGPQWLLIEPIMGFSSGDITETIAEGAYAGDPAGLIENASAEELLAVCEDVKSRIVADDEAGTVTITLAQPWGPFLPTLAGSWGRIVDQDWAVEQGSWDGTCETWQEHYAPGAENSPLTAAINGTGPYALDHWTPDEEYVLVANENYWRTEDTPMWEGGPFGVAPIKTVIVRNVSEWGTRFAALQAGDAESVTVNQENVTQVDPLVGEFCDWRTFECTANEENPEGILRKWDNLPTVSRTDAFLTWNVAEDSPYIGSGQLDGNGIPPNFFSDENVRKAFATCFNYDIYNQEVLLGKGVRNNGPIIKDMLGYNEDGAYYEYDPEQCASYLEQAWDGQLPETGFRFQIAYNTGNTTRQTVAEIFQSELAAINPLYQIETVGLPWPTFLRSFRASQLPVSISGWIEDIHDPHNWAQPFTVGTFGGRQGLPEEVQAEFEELVTAGVLAATPEERAEIYYQLQERYHDLAVAVTLLQGSNYRYEQPWVNGYYYWLGQFAPNYYAMSLDGGASE